LYVVLVVFGSCLRRRKMNRKDGKGRFVLALIVVLVMLTALVKDVTATPIKEAPAPVVAISR
jgi:hypothetical protein